MKYNTNIPKVDFFVLKLGILAKIRDFYDLVSKVYNSHAQI